MKVCRVAGRALLSGALVTAAASIGLTLAPSADAFTGTAAAATTVPAPPRASAPLSAWQAWATAERASMTTAALTQLTDSSLAPGCSLGSVQVEPMTSNGQFGVPNGVVVNIGITSGNCSAAPAGAVQAPTGESTAEPATSVECPVQSSGVGAGAYAGYVCIGLYASNNSYRAASYINTSSSSVTGTLTMKDGEDFGTGQYCYQTIGSDNNVTAVPDQWWAITYNPGPVSNYFGSYWSLGGSVCHPF